MDYHTLTADKAKIEDSVAFEKASMEKNRADTIDIAPLPQHILCTYI